MTTTSLRSWTLAALVASIATLLILAGCSDGDSDDRTSENDMSSGICAEGDEDCEDTPTEAPDNSTLAPTPQPCTDPASCQEQAISIARRDLAAQLGLEVSSITVVSSEAVEWPDSCLDAAQPGTVCAQVITPGFRILLESGGTQYVYHANNGTRAVLLEQP